MRTSEGGKPKVPEKKRKDQALREKKKGGAPEIPFHLFSFRPSKPTRPSELGVV